MNVAKEPRDIGLPGLHLHPLKGERKGTWALSVSGNWRITFAFSGPDVVDVDYEDYHGGVAMKMHNPPHPGEVLRELCFDPLGLTVTEAANALGVSRKTLSSAESWLSQQLQYDLAKAETRRRSLRVKKLAAA